MGSRSALGGLIAGVVLLLSLSPFAFRGARRLVPLAYFLSIFMLANGLQHIGGSIYLGGFMPGVFSSPLLIAASLWLWTSLRRRRHAAY